MTVLRCGLVSTNFLQRAALAYDFVSLCKQYNKKVVGFLGGGGGGGGVDSSRPFCIPLSSFTWMTAGAL